MTKIELTPQQLDEILDMAMLNFIEVTGTHLMCLCKKNRHKRCPRHNFQQMAKVVYDNRQPIGDKILHSQSKKIIMPVTGGNSSIT
jgi:hypothetical protein